MGTLLIILLPILVVDALNPILFAGVVYALGTRHPVINATALLLSFFLCYFLSGLAIALTLEAIVESFHLPEAFDYILELGVAGCLFYFAWKQHKTGDEHREQRLQRAGTLHLKEAVQMGFQINLIGLPFAIPYLAAIDQMLKANLSAWTTGGILLLYNVLYVLPFALMLALRWWLHEESAALFSRINGWMHRILERYLPWLFLLLGLLLLEDAVSYLLGYREYSFLSLMS